MQTVLHTAGSRGDANHGWLHSKHSFSFANYYHPEKTHFGMLRVLNDDFVDAGMGFGLHPHDNMEIISIPLEGDLAHQDSMGNQTVIQFGDIQVMSAGTGIQHSEYNHNKDKPVKFLQIWVMPNKKNVRPRYDQITLNPTERINTLQQILSPNPEDPGVWIHQDAWFHIGKFDLDFSINYSLKKASNGLYAFVLSGSFEVAGQQLAQRDALGMSEIDPINEPIQMKALTDQAEILLIEVPMQFT